MKQQKAIPPKADEGVMFIIEMENKTKAEHEAKRKQIKDGYTALIKKSYNFNLDLKQTELLKRQIQQAIDIYQYAKDNDDPLFVRDNLSLLNEAINHLTGAYGRVIERVNTLKENENKDALPPLPNDDRAEYFKLLFSNAFPAIEQRLYDAGYIDINRKWLNTAHELVGFLLAVSGENYFMSMKTKKHQKDFFKSRYQKNIDQAHEPDKQKPSKQRKDYFINLIKEVLN
ncbi:MAG: hypothetical protein M9933_17795 [Chitinophagaceae bacterium]|nr:hypothetical protein [Chitinophagaceae bacterium]